MYHTMDCLIAKIIEIITIFLSTYSVSPVQRTGTVLSTLHTFLILFFFHRGKYEVDTIIIISILKAWKLKPQKCPVICPSCLSPRVIELIFKFKQLGLTIASPKYIVAQHLLVKIDFR